MVQRPALPFIALCALLVPPAAAAQEGPAPPLGRYDFRSVTVEGDPFTGTIHITSLDEDVKGLMYTSIRPAMPVTRVDLVGTSFTVVARFPGADSVVFFGELEGDRFSGSWALLDRVEPFEGSRVPTDDDNNLEPVACEVRGLDELVRCARYHVPEDRGTPGSRKIGLNIVILPARSSDPAPDPLFTLAGGPGQAATDGASGNASRFSRILRDRDIVMVDQRGTGGSNGLPCEFETTQEQALMLLGWVFPPEAVRACRAELEWRADLRFYTTTQAAADMEAVRAWLGYEQINVYGGSYGTRAALEYLRRHPERVRTATLRGVLAPGGNLAADNPADAQASFQRLLDDCAADDRCGSAYERLGRKLNTVLLKLQSDPATVRVYDGGIGDTVSIEITRDVFAGGVRRLLMDANSQRFLPMVIQRAFEGDFGAFRPAVTATLAVARSLYFGMGLSVFCAEDYEALLQRDLVRDTQGTFLGMTASNTLLAACQEWDRGTSPSDFHEPVEADTPVLLLSGALDPTTPPRWGDEVAAALPNSLHLVLEGTAHSPFPRCAQSIMADFIAAGTADGLDTGCVDRLERLPFAVSGGR